MLLEADGLLAGMATALVLVDIQNDYFPGGAHPLESPDAAAAAATRLLELFRATGEPVIHVRHVWDEDEATFMRPGTAGVDIHSRVRPLDGELIVTKAHPNSFRETELEAELRERGIDSLVVCGMMTSMCVDATVRAAVDLGFETTVAHDACATCDLEFDGRTIPAAAVHAAFLAALADGYATVASSEEIAG
jgi:nicotinamidase-related amidase